MNRILLIVALVFAVFGIAFTILPMGTLALIPVAIGIVCSLIVIYRNRNQKFPRILFILLFLNLLTIIGRDVFVEDKVETDAQFENIKQQSEQEAQKELEELENL